MIHAAMLLPTQAMMEDAVFAANFYQLHLSSLVVLKRGASRKEAELAVESGADLIIARGGQATEIARYVSVPVIEIKLTSHEIGLLLEQARRLSPKKKPCIALVGPENMFVHLDPSMFEKQYDVFFRTYLFSEHSEMLSCAQKALEEGADVMIGGPDVFQYCQQRQLPCLRTSSGRESLMETCRVAQLVGAALEQEKAHSASLNLLLSHASSGIIQTDECGNILRVNSFVEHILLTDSHAMEGNPIWDWIPGISSRMMETVCGKKREIHSIAIQHGKMEFIVSIRPILVDQTVTGSIISFHEGLYLREQEKQLRQKIMDQGCRARASFHTLIARSPVTQELVRAAQRAASFYFPVLISGPGGCGKHQFAECIHNSSGYRDQPFISFHCGGYNPEPVEQALFGYLGSDQGTAKSALENSGEKSGSQGLLLRGPCTLYLQEIEALSIHAQQRLLAYLKRSSLIQNTAENPRDEARIIVSSTHSLQELVNEGRFLPELYYAVQTLTLSIPPLKDRREDIMGWADYFLRGLQEQYGRYIRLTRDAQTFLTGYDWPGNLWELQSVCQRIMANCSRYYVDASAIEQLIMPTRRLTADSCPDRVSGDASSPLSPSAASERDVLIRTLHKYEGRRDPTASELGISVSTLWRQMKKYRIPKEEGKKK